MQETTHPVYDYQSLESFFEDISTIQEVAAYLDKLLYCLVYYQYKEGIDMDEFARMYFDIHELKEVLQEINNQGHGNK
jgi:hypothetical protein